MKKIGIVVEYNPFHNGHLYQIEEIRHKYGKDAFIAVVMSGDFVQRGQISYMDKWEKTETALKSGIDLVVELPLYYSIQNAEIFAKMSTRILEKLGLEIQVFGAEEDDRKVMDRIIRLQAQEEYIEKLKMYIKKGNSYSASQRKVLAEYGYEDIVKSNNILALEYMRAIYSDNMKIEPYIIKREISEYNEKEIDCGRKKIASATFIRNYLENRRGTLSEIRGFLPEISYRIIEKKQMEAEKMEIKSITATEGIFKLLKYKLLMETKKEIIKIYDITEEIYARIYREIKKSDTYKIFLTEVKSRNFSNKRIERIVLNILLGITEEVMDFELDYIRILGFNKKGREYLKDLKLLSKDKENKNKVSETDEVSEEKIYVNWKDIEKNVESKKVKIEKNGFLIKELLTGKKERLNPLIINENESAYGE